MAPTEKKTVVGVVVTAAVGFLIAILNGVQDNPGVLGSMPTWLQGVLLTLVPPILTWLAQYNTPHTVRDDAAAQAEAAKVGLKVVPTNQMA